MRVVGGLFAGQLGVIRGLKPKDRKIVLEIKFLGARLEVDIEEQQVQKLG